jgi:hypothetical protein
MFFQMQIKSNKGVNELKRRQSLFLLLLENRIYMCRSAHVSFYVVRVCKINGACCLTCIRM